MQKLYIYCKDIYIPGFVSLQNVSLFVSISCTIFWYNAEPASAHSQEYCAIQFLRTSKYLYRKNGSYYYRGICRIRNKYMCMIQENTCMRTIRGKCVWCVIKYVYDTRINILCTCTIRANLFNIRKQICVRGKCVRMIHEQYVHDTDKYV